MATILILDDRATNRNIYARLAAAIEEGVAAGILQPAPRHDHRSWRIR